MKHKSVLAKLYYTLIHADNKMNEREVALGRQMVHCEGLPESSFQSEVDSLSGKPTTLIYNEIVEGLKQLEPALQVRCIAWMCVIANADGFMDKKEWQFIYQIITDTGIVLQEVLNNSNTRRVAKSFSKVCYFILPLLK